MYFICLPLTAYRLPLTAYRLPPTAYRCAKSPDFELYALCFRLYVVNLFGFFCLPPTAYRCCAKSPDFELYALCFRLYVVNLFGFYLPTAYRLPLTAYRLPLLRKVPALAQAACTEFISVSRLCRQRVREEIIF